MVTEAVVTHLREAQQKDSKEAAPLYAELTQHYRQRLATLQSGNSHGDAVDRGRFLQLFLEALRVERQTAIRLRNENLINDDDLRRMERELDLAESRLALAN